jgi:hypothetical protein
MTNRITQKHLEELVAIEAKASHLDLDLNYSFAYGGYQITYNNGSSILMHRSLAKETKQFLNGMQAGRYVQSGYLQLRSLGA